MPIVRIEHKVVSYDRWREAFDRDPADRRGSGVQRYQVLRGVDDPNYVLIDLEFAALDQAQRFLQKMREIWAGPGKAVMQRPIARIVEVEEVQAF